MLGSIFFGIPIIISKRSVLTISREHNLFKIFYILAEKIKSKHNQVDLVISCYSFAHIDDMVDSYLAVLKAHPRKINGQIFNVGFKNQSVNELAKDVKEII